MTEKDEAQQWFESLGQEIQDYEVPPLPDEPAPDTEATVDDTPEEPFADVPSVTAQQASSVLNLQRINRPTASIIVGVMDTVLPILLALVVKGAVRDDMELEDSERETLTDAWAVYLGDKNVQASPGAVLITSIATIYGAKLFDAMQHAKLRRQEELLAEQQQRLDDQSVELEELRRQRQTLRQQLEAAQAASETAKK